MVLFSNCDNKTMAVLENSEREERYFKEWKELHINVYEFAEKMLNLNWSKIGG